MLAGELFLNIGIKGDDKVRNVLSDTNTGFKNLGSQGLAAKAAIVAAIYALERLGHQSMETGTSILNFNALTNVSTGVLQGWRNAFQLAGSSAEEANHNIMSVQDAMGRMALNKGIPEGMTLMAQTLGGLDYNKMKTDATYLLEKGREFAKITKGSPNVAAYNEILRSIGFSDTMIASARRGLLDPSMLEKASRFNFSEGTLARLDKTNEKWREFFKMLEKAIGDLNAKHGLTIISEIGQVTSKVIILVDKLIILSEKMKVFQALNFLFDAAGKATGQVSDLADDITPGKKGIGERASDVASKLWGDVKGGISAEAQFADVIGTVVANSIRTNLGLSPITINQTNSISGVKEPQKVGHAIGEHTRKAFASSKKNGKS